MQMDYKSPEARCHDLHVNGAKVEDWVRADEATGEYELFVTDLPWRGGGRIVDTDNPTGFQTLQQTGKVEFKRNSTAEPLPTSYSEAEPKPAANPFDPWGMWSNNGNPLESVLQPEDLVGLLDRMAPRSDGSSVEPSLRTALNFAVLDSIADEGRELDMFGHVCSFDEFLTRRSEFMEQFQRSVTFTSEDGEVWDFTDETGHRGQVRFLDTRVTGDFLEVEMEPLGWQVDGEEPVQATLRVYSPGYTWAHLHQGDSLTRRTFSLISFCEQYKLRGLQLFQWLDSLEIQIRQEVGLPV